MIRQLRSIKDPEVVRTIRHACAARCKNVTLWDLGMIALSAVSAAALAVPLVLVLGLRGATAWAAILLCSFFSGIAFACARIRRSQRLVMPEILQSLGRCDECGYDLTGSQSDICPECGKHRGAEPVG